MNKALIQKFIQLISTNTGLHIREQDREALSKKIWTQMKLLNLSRPETYYQLLEAQAAKNDSPSETPDNFAWKELILLLTTGESYFFRDEGQFTLLENRILPELIEHRKKVQHAKAEARPSLRIWSAGCSTGEEAYSLAMLLRKLIRDWDQWNILILGTDINQAAIQQAKRGIYSSWSFRKVDPNLQAQYFHQQKMGWEIDEQIRWMVKFYAGNLMKDTFPSYASDIHRMDLILCRNVFIYFDSQAVSIVLEKFYHTLRSGGYLVTGHAELHGLNLGQLQAKFFPESVVYQRSEHLQAEPPLTPRSPVSATLAVSPLEQSLTPRKTLNSFAAAAELMTGKMIHAVSPSIAPLAKQNSEINFQTVLSQAEMLFRNKAYPEAIKKAEQAIALHSSHFAAYFLMAQVYANLGEYEKSKYYCQQALEVDSLSAAPYYLLAHVAEEQGKPEEAIRLLKKTIYLMPSSIPAYLELGSLYAREGDQIRAQKMWGTAFDLLQELPPDTTLEQEEKVTARELLLQVKNLLQTSR
jgi:chemotaxis protein methyltransferase CheR